MLTPALMSNKELAKARKEEMNTKTQRKFTIR